MSTILTFPIPTIDDYAKKRGVCILGETGTGITVTLSALIRADLEKSKRTLVIDPSGGLTEELGGEHSGAIVWQVNAKSSPYFIDLFQSSDEKDIFQTADTIINLMYSLYDPQRTGIIGPRFEQVVRNSVIALLDANQGSFTNLIKIISEPNFAESILPSIKHENVRQYFVDLLAHNSNFQKNEVTEYVISKLSILTEMDSIGGNLTQAGDRKSISSLLAESNQLVIIDLSLLLDLPVQQRNVLYELVSNQLQELVKRHHTNMPQTSLIIDEINRFTFSDFDSFAQAARKQQIDFLYTISGLATLTTGDQYSFLAGKSVISYRVAPPDAAILAPYFTDNKTANELTTLPNFQFVARIRTEEGISFSSSSV